MLDLVAKEGAHAILAALTSAPRRLPSWLHYDAAGAKLFEALCELDAYYLARIELAILDAHAGDIATLVGPRAVVIEPGAGSAKKTELLLGRLDRPARWVPIDIADAQLSEAAERVRRRFPGVDVVPVCADYRGDVALPDRPAGAGRRVAFFPGSTIGNFDPPDALRFLGRLRAMADLVLVGVDLEKDPAILELAYDDPQGVTAAFCRNMLAHVNAAFGADFDLSAWRHRARWNPAEHRMEMHLVAARPTSVHLSSSSISFEENDEILVERSYKYTVERFARIAALAELSVLRVWTDARGWFAVFLLEPRAG